MPDLSNPFNLLAVAFEIAIKSLFALAIINLLKEIQPHNRKIVPGLVWLLIIPELNLVWNFVVAVCVSSSLRKELDERNYDVKGQPTLILGLVYALLSCSALFIPVPKDIKDPSNSTVYGILGLAVIVFFVQYWMKINWYKTVIRNDSLEPETKEEL